jgi:hypothetical protein
MENGRVERFNRKLQDHVLNREIIPTQAEAKVLIVRLMLDYPHFSTKGRRKPKTYEGGMKTGYSDCRHATERSEKSERRNRLLNRLGLAAIVIAIWLVVMGAERGRATVSAQTSVMTAAGGITRAILSGNPVGVPLGLAGYTGERAGHIPWYDVQAYGALPRPASISNETTTATTTAGLPTVSIAAAQHFIDGDGVVIWKAGAATQQTTPAAATVTSPAVTGTRTFNYECVGVDAMGGLTAAGPSGSTTGPTIFGNPNVGISTIEQSNDVVTVNFSSPIDASTGQTVDISGVLEAGSILNGFWTIASAPNPSQITYHLPGNVGVGTVNTSSVGRLTNQRNITEITRTGTTIKVTTDGNHNFLFQESPNRTVAIISGVSPSDFDGQYVVLSASENTLTLDTGYSTVPETMTETGSTRTGSSIITVWEFNTIKCPPISDPTVAYYVYGDSAGERMALLGETLYTQRTWTDWGPLQGGGFIAPGYVPTIPPPAAQNQIFASTILSGGGSKHLTLANSVTSAVSDQLIMHDDGQGVLAAALAALAKGGHGATIHLSPGSATGSQYIINTPLVIPPGVELIVGTPLVANESIFYLGSNHVTVPFGSSGANTPQFGQRNYVPVSGIAKSYFIFNRSNSNVIDGLEFLGGHNGQNYVLFNDSDYDWVKDVSLANQSNSGTSVGLTYQNDSSWQRLTNIHSLSYSPLGNIHRAGLIPYGPPIPMIWFRSSDGGGQTVVPSSVTMDGKNHINGRGILFDLAFRATGAFSNHFFDNLYDQAATTPTVMVYGGTGSTGGNLEINYPTNDSAGIAVFANWSNMVGPVRIKSGLTSSNGFGFAGLVTGSVIPGLTIYGGGRLINNVGQNINVLIDQAGGAIGGFYNTRINNVTQPAVSGLQSFTGFGQPVRFYGPWYPPAFWEFPPIVDLSTSYPTSGGKVPVGTHTYCVAAVGWTDGWGACSNTISVTTTAGNQTVRLAWSPVNGARGYMVFRDGLQCPGGIATGYSYDTPTNSFRDIAATCNAPGSEPTLSAAGPASIDADQVVDSVVRLINGNRSAAISSDESGKPFVNGAPINSTIQASDSFARADGSLGANWTAAHGTLSISNANVVGTSQSTANVALWAGTGSFSSGSQFSQIQVASLLNSPGAIGAAVYGSGSGATANAYFCSINAISKPFVEIGKIVHGATSILATSSAKNGRIGDVLSLSAVPNLESPSDSLTCSLNGAVILSFVDSSGALLRGTPGLYISGNSSSIRLENWVGGIGAVNYSQDGTWTATQSFLATPVGIKFTGSAPTCAFTSGGGVSPTCVLAAGSTNHSGTIIMRTGSGSLGSRGSFTLKFTSIFGTNAPVCIMELSDGGSGQWNEQAALKDNTPSTTSDVQIWSNNRVPLSTSTTYWINYHCFSQ